ncbi:TetR/AcrR family transcriptional regulator [Novosphingobium sp. BL-8H]|uniref:TetR/AcrR family transcriptional regulator n=1 Tax=Novosphingobium sp. BL-8H TaxID=3127640 RepID=UPI003757A772
MTSNRRIGTESSDTRRQLLIAAGELMREEGYAEVTSRKLAQRAGLKPQLVHYYFRTMGELFEALFKFSTERYLAQLDRIATGKDPLARLFELNSDPTGATMQLEFLALANHRKEMHELIAEFGQELNNRVAAIVRAEMADHGLPFPQVSPEEIAAILEAVARGLAFSGRFNEDRFASTRKAISTWLETIASSRRT